MLLRKLIQSSKCCFEGLLANDDCLFRMGVNVVADTPPL